MGVLYWEKPHEKIEEWGIMHQGGLHIEKKKGSIGERWGKARCVKDRILLFFEQVISPPYLGMYEIGKGNWWATSSSSPVSLTPPRSTYLLYRLGTPYLPITPENCLGKAPQTRPRYALAHKLHYTLLREGTQGIPCINVVCSSSSRRGDWWYST